MAKPDRKHQYAGVASSDGNGGGGDDGLPVATAIQVAGTATSLRRGSSSPSAHDTSDKKGDGGGSGGANIHDVAGTDADENDGIQITWEKGEAQRPAFRDVWFAVAFVVVRIVLGTWGTYYYINHYRDHLVNVDARLFPEWQAHLLAAAIATGSMMQFAFFCQVISNALRMREAPKAE